MINAVPITCLVVIGLLVARRWRDVRVPGQHQLSGPLIGVAIKSLVYSWFILLFSHSTALLPIVVILVVITSEFIYMGSFFFIEKRKVKIGDVRMGAFCLWILILMTTYGIRSGMVVARRVMLENVLTGLLILLLIEGMVTSVRSIYALVRLKHFLSSNPEGDL